MSTPSNAATTAAVNQAKAAQMNMALRNAWIQSAVEMKQPVYTATVNPAQINPVQIQPRYVGLVKRFIIEITGTITNNDAANACALTDLGIANILAAQNGITFTDLSNNQRVNTGGWHLSFLNSIKHRKPYAAGFAVETDEMSAYGETFGVLSAPANIAAAGTANFRAVFELPIAYSDDNLKGALPLNVVNATAQISLLFNTQNLAAANGKDSTFSVYKFSAAGTNTCTLTSATVNVTQVYLDQGPRDPKTGAYLFPLDDVSVNYELKNTSLANIPANQDFPFQYPNFRDILSTISIFNHDTSADAGRTAGTDVNYFEIQSANYTAIQKLTPLLLSQINREILQTDLPKGCYHLSSRRKPISSVQYGNITNVINASTSSVNSMWYLGLEMFNYPNIVVNAGSIQG